ncbi:MAG TPA: hypothetical protein VHM88_04695, partial [Candidatus Acidoferrales bacterium]|nr:hypothetical protein [Candidatus Acidoferrales bacterium]
MKKLKALLIPGLALLIPLGVSAQSTSGANNAALKGDYAFSFTGFTASSGSATVFAAVGRFTADGAGNVTKGVLDSNGVSAGSVSTAQAFTGSYTIGAEQRGTLALNIAGGTKTFAFAMLANGNAQFIEFDAAGGTGTVGSGTIEKADSTAFNSAQISGDYAFGLVGLNATNNRASFAGRFTSDGAGNLSNAAGDINASGTVGSAVFTASTYTVSDTASGRGTTSWSFVFNGTSFTLNFVFYTVNTGKLLLMETDPLTGSLPVLSGAMVRQQTPAGGFSNASLNGGVVLSLTGFTPCTSGGAPAPVVIVALLTADGKGGFTLSFDENCGGIGSTATGLSGLYAAERNGRVVITVGTSPEIAYLIDTNRLFFLSIDAAAGFGPGEAQASGAFDNSSLAGNYAGLATVPAGSGVTIFSGEFTADGSSATGNLTGTADIGNASGATSGAAFRSTYSVSSSVSSSPTNGRASVNVASAASSGGSAVAYVISPSEFVMFPLGDP